MADWRPDGGRRPRQNPDPPPEQPAPPPAEPDQPRQSWRRNRGDGGQRAAGKSYLDPGSNDNDEVSRAKLIRLSKIIVSFCILLAAFGWLLWWLFINPVHVPFVLVTLTEETTGRAPKGEPHLVVPTPFHVETGLHVDAAEGSEDNNGFFADINKDIEFERVKFAPSMINDDEHVKLRIGLEKDHAVVSYFVAATAVATSKENLWVLGNGGDPYRIPDDTGTEKGTQRPSWRAVSLAKLLEQLVSQSPKDSKVVVFLELTQPPPIMEIGRMLNPIPEGIRTIHTKLEKKIRSRLCIVMSCDDGQKNWPAPELERTVFGHFVARALAGEADGYEDPRSEDNKVTVVEMTAFVSDKVADWVAKYRYARQTPSVLWPESSSELKSSIVAAAVAREPSEPAKAQFSEIQDRIAKLEDLWERYRQHRNDPYADSVELGILEARLIRLEQLTVRGKRLSHSLWEIPSKGIRPPEPQTGSLYERTDLSRRELASELGKWIDDKPPFLRPPPDDGEVPLPPTFSSRVDKTWLVWQWFLHECEKQPAIVMNQDVLVKALAYLDDIPGAHSIPWQERQLLDLIASELDWERYDDSTDDLQQLSVAISYLIRCRHHLQTNAVQRSPDVHTGIRNEVHFWIRDDVTRFDAIWRLAFDQILSSQPEQTKQAASSLGTLEDRLTGSRGLSENTKTVEKALTARNDANQKLPHFLRWSLLELQVDDRAIIRERLVTIRKAFHQATELADDLRDSSTTMDDLAKSADGMNGLISELDQQFDKFVKEDCKVDTEKAIDATVYRYARIALQSPPPLLNQQERKSLYQICLRYWDTYRDGDAFKGKRPAAVDLSEEIQKFKGITTATRQWERLTQPYWSPSIFKFDEWTGFDANMAGRSNHERALAAEQRVRPFTLFLGEFLEGLDRAESIRGMIADRNKLAAIEQKCWQAERVVLDMWGDGGPLQDEPYFVRLAKYYRGQSPMLADYRRARNSEAEKLSDASVKYLKASGVKWADSDKNLGRTAATVETSFVPPNQSTLDEEQSLSTVYLLADGKRHGFDVGSASVRGWSFGPNDASKSKVLNIPLDGLDLPAEGVLTLVGVTAFRGNHLTRKINLHVPKPDPKYRVVAFEKYEPKPPTLRVRGISNGIFRVVLILDGSDSTKMPTVSAESTDSTIIEELKKTGKVEVLQTLRSIHESGEARVKVKLIAFGGFNRDRVMAFEPIGAKWEALRQKNGDAASYLISTSFVDATPANISQLADLMDEIVPSGVTPLYDSIMRGLEGKPKEDEKPIVIALTDGVNFSNHSDQVSVVTLRDAIKASPVSVHVVEFGNAAYYEIAEPNSKTPEADIVAKEAALKKGNAEIAELEDKLKDKFKHFTSKNLIELRREIAKLVPRITYKIMAVGAKRDDPPIAGPFFLNEPSVDLQFLQDKLPVDVVVRVNNEIVKQTLDRELKVRGSEWFQLDYVGGRKPLKFPEHKSNNGLRRPSDSELWTSPEKRLPHLEMWLHQPFEKVGPNKNSVEFVVSFQNQTKDDFTPRPTFLLAEIKRRSGLEKDRLFDIFDFQYLPSHRWRNGEHYPFARFAWVPWYDDAINQPRTDAEMKLWISNEPPPVEDSIEIEVDQDVRREEIGKARDVLNMQWTADTVVVRLHSQTPGKPVDRWIIQLPGAIAVERQYADDDSEVVHTFHLPTDREPKLTVQVINVETVQRQLHPPVVFDARTIGK